MNEAWLTVVHHLEREAYNLEKTAIIFLETFFFESVLRVKGLLHLGCLQGPDQYSCSEELILLPVVSNLGTRSYLALLITGIPHFLKVPVTLLHFYKGPALVPIFADRKRPRGDFFTKTVKKRKEPSVQCAFYREPSGYGGCAPGAAGSQPELPNPDHAWHLHFQLCPWASVLCLYLFSESLSKMCSKVSEILEKGYFFGSGNAQNFSI